VDGQRLLDNAGEEERYLKSLMTNFRNGLQALTRDLLVDGKPYRKHSQAIYQGRQGDSAVFMVPSGTYQFESEWKE